MFVASPLEPTLSLFFFLFFSPHRHISVNRHHQNSEDWRRSESSDFYLIFGSDRSEMALGRERVHRSSAQTRKKSPGAGNLQLRLAMTIPGTRRKHGAQRIL